MEINTNSTFSNQPVPNLTLEGMKKAIASLPPKPVMPKGLSKNQKKIWGLMDELEKGHYYVILYKEMRDWHIPEEFYKRYRGQLRCQHDPHIESPDQIWFLKESGDYWKTWN